VLRTCCSVEDMLQCCDTWCCHMLPQGVATCCRKQARAPPSRAYIEGGCHEGFLSGGGPGETPPVARTFCRGPASICRPMSCHSQVSCLKSHVSCMYVCMYVYMYVCMYVCMYIHMHACVYGVLRECTHKSEREHEDLHPRVHVHYDVVRDNVKMILATRMYPPPHMTCMYPPPHMTCMYPPHMTCMYPPPHMTCMYPSHSRAREHVHHNKIGKIQELLKFYIIYIYRGDGAGGSHGCWSSSGGGATP